MVVHLWSGLITIKLSHPIVQIFDGLYFSHGYDLLDINPTGFKCINFLSDNIQQRLIRIHQDKYIKQVKAKMQKKISQILSYLSMHKPSLKQSSYESISPQKLTQSIVKNNHYVYIDINSQHGLCQAQQINPQDADQDVQFLACNNYLCGIAELPQLSQKTIDYVYKIQQLKKQRQKFKQLLRDEINKTFENKLSHIKRKNKNKNNKSVQQKHVITKSPKDIAKNQIGKPLNRARNYSTIESSKNIQQNYAHQSSGSVNQNLIMYRGMQTQQLRLYLQKKQLEKINQTILQKQKILVSKYRFTNQFESITKQKSFILRKNRKIILPEIRSQSKIIF